MLLVVTAALVVWIAFSGDVRPPPPPFEEGADSTLQVAWTPDAESGFPPGSSGARTPRSPPIVPRRATIDRPFLGDSRDRSGASRGEHGEDANELGEYSFTTDSPVVVSEIHYHPLGDEESEKAFELVELLNRSSAPVRVAKWRLAGAVRYEIPAKFPPLESGGRLVIARDPEALRTAAGIRPESILGPYDGALSNRGETLLLVDDSGTVRDRVPWREGGLWPALADGLGASLERISCDAPGPWPQNWTVAHPEIKASRVIELVGHGSNIRWLESPKGTDPWQRNGKSWFEPGFDDRAAGFRDGRLAVGYDLQSARPGWILTSSTHQAGLHSIWIRIAFDARAVSGAEDLVPELWIDADDGWIAWLDGDEIARGSTSLERGALPRPDGRYWGTVTDASGDRLLEPSFVRVWRGAPGSLEPGKHLLAIANGNANASSSDLFLSARLVLVESRGVEGSTPGRPSKLERPGLAPLVDSIERTPEIPRSGDPVTIRCRVLGPEARSVVLRVVDRDGVEEIAMARADEPSRTYVATIPPRPEWSIVRFHIVATGVDGATFRSPREGDPAADHAYYVEGEIPSAFAGLDALHILWSGEPTCSDGEWVDGAVFIERGTAWIESRVKYRGDTSCWRPKKGLRIAFPKGRPFLGQDRLNLLAGWEDRSLLREVIAWELFRDLGHPYCEAKLVSVFAERGRPRGVYIALEPPSPDFLERNGIDRDAALWKSRNAFQNAWVGGVEELTDVTDEDRLALERFARDVSSLHGDELIEWVKEKVDVESLLDYQTVKSLISDEDGFEKNWLLLRELEKRDDGREVEKWRPLPWDLDLSFGQIHLGTDFHHYDKHPLMGTRDHPRGGSSFNGLLDAVLGGRAEDYFVRALYARLWSALEEKFRPEVLFPRIDELAEMSAESARADLERWPRWGQAPQDPDFHRERLREYVRRRHEFLTSFLTSENPTTQIWPASSSGVGEPGARRRARGGGNYREFRYVPVPRLKITEISPDRGGSGELEFIEIVNVESREVDLSGFDIPAVDWTFPKGARIAAHGVIVVARDPDGLRRFAGDIPAPIFGPYKGALDAKGEMLRLRDSGLGPDGRVTWPVTIDAVRYGAYGPWPRPGRGSGRSIELRDIEYDNDYAEHWTESAGRGGTPGVPRQE